MSKVPKKIRRRLCRECRHAFETTNKKRWFCSKLCLNRFFEARRVRDRKVHPKTCGHCGEAFKGGAKTTLYCSRTCSAKHKWAKGTLVPYKRTYFKPGAAHPFWTGGLLAAKLRQYGLTAEDYDALLERQNGVCAICFKPPKGKSRLSVDHDHVTGRVRGLLCGPCNCSIGLLNEDADVFQSAINYLNAANVPILQ